MIKNTPTCLSTSCTAYVLACCSVLSMGLLSTTANAQSKLQGLSMGAGVVVEHSPYRDYDNRTWATPVFNYEANRMFIHGSHVGVKLLNTETQQFYVDISYMPLRFKRSDTSNLALKQLDKRKSTAMAGIGYVYKHDTLGNIHAQVAVDVLDNSNGLMADVAYQYPMQVGKLRLEPGIGVQWQDSNHNDYYYGVSAREAQRSGLNQYNPGSSTSAYANITAYYAFNKNWSAFVMGRYNRLSSAAKDSPMTGRSHSAIYGGGVMYTF